MGRKFTTLAGGLLFLLSSSAFSIEPKTQIAREAKELLSVPNCHECVLQAIDLSNFAINRLYSQETNNQQAIYELSMLLVESGNPANALKCSYKLGDFGRRYEIAEALIRSGNPLNGVKCLESMSEEYIIKGINLLEQTGNFRNALMLKDFLMNPKRD